MNSSTSSSSSGSDSERSVTENGLLKRKRRELSTARDTESEADGRDENEFPPNGDALKARRKRTLEKDIKVEQAVYEQGGEEGQEEEGEEDEEVENAKPLSHKQQRRLKKKLKLADGTASEPATARAPTEAVESKKSKRKNGKTDEKELPKRQNSVWVGNLAFHTTAESLRAFFDGVGNLTRVHMPMKKVIVKDDEKNGRKQNRGFAYVDFSTPDAKTIAITLSEKNLDGRRLLIKDGADFAGRPASVAGAISGEDAASPDGNSALSTKSGLSKSAQQILARQKQPAGPCLFLGNLGFETTDDSIRGMLEGHARSLARMRASKEKKEKRKLRAKRKAERDVDLLGIEKEENEDEHDKTDSEPTAVEIDVGIRKVRMGTFEDSGMCKGFAFVDFDSAAHATAALTNTHNHFLDGRKLVVEYASPDAVRRGGHREKRNKSSTAEKASVPSRRTDGRDARMQKGTEAKNHKQWKAREDDVTEDLEADDKEGERHAKTQYQNRRGRTENYTKNRKRPTPGAALAQAKREKVAIVPSQGTRLTFT